MKQFEQTRRIVTALGALFLVLIITGCGQESTPAAVTGTTPDGTKAEKVKLLWLMGRDETQSALLRSTIQSFEAKHPNIEVELQEISGNYYQKVTVMLAGGTPPDILWMGQAFGEFAARGAFLDLTSRIAADIDISEFYPEVLNWYTVNGKQYGIPHGIDMQMIIYNKKAFEEAGLAQPKDDWTIEAFVAAAQKLTLDRDGDGRTDQYGFSGRLPHCIWGAHFVSKDGTKALCDTPQMAAWARFHLDMVHKWKVSPSSEKFKSEGLEGVSAFRQGRAAMMECATFLLPQYREKCADMEWDIVASPTVGDNERAHWASSSAFLATANTPHPDEAWLFIQHLISDNLQMAFSGQSLPSKKRVARKFVEENTLKPPNIKCLIDSVDYLHPFPRVANLNELESHFNDSVDRIFVSYGSKKPVAPEAAFKEAARRMDATIAKRMRR